jgi:Protein of unknown function (DUF2958)
MLKEVFFISIYFSSMQLLTKDILTKFNQMGSQETIDDPIVILKVFYPAWSYTWLLTEFYPDTRQFFGYIIWSYPEWWYVSLDELESFRGRFGLSFERDRYCGYKPLSEHLNTLWIANL